MEAASKVLLYNKVNLDDGTVGIVRYMGSVMGKKGAYYGIDVTKGVSKNNVRHSMRISYAETIDRVL